MNTVILLVVVLYASSQNVSAITGGESAAEGEFPFMVSIKDSRGCHLCGGTIIGDSWIISSNYCYSRSFWGFISFGNKIHNDDINDCEVYNSTIHKKIDDVLYNPWAMGQPPYTHDLILIHLQDPIDFGKTVQPVRLPEVDEPWPYNRNGTMLGWAKGREVLKPNTELQKAQVPLYSDEYCLNPTLWESWNINDIEVMKCGGVVNETYYCYFDYGGPLLVDGKQYGIISYVVRNLQRGSGCGEFLGIYSPVSYFRSWIEFTTGI